jgi:hypothetical protein
VVLPEHPTAEAAEAFKTQLIKALSSKESQGFIVIQNSENKLFFYKPRLRLLLYLILGDCYEITRLHAYKCVAAAHFACTNPGYSDTVWQRFFDHTKHLLYDHS